jgi:peptidoglycan/xylan/chitin deacetylase (PgdA/CDA1 family)
MSVRAALSRTRQQLKAVHAGALQATGVLGRRLQATFRDRAIVLMYHRVLPPAERHATWSHPGIVVERDTFARQIAALTEHFDVVAVDALVAHVVEKRPFTRPTCAITFDDGWLDNYTHAWPVLEAARVPFLIFLSTSFIGTGTMFWQERLKALLAEAAAAARADAALRDRLRARLAAERLAGLLELHGEALRRAAMDAVHARKGDHAEGSAKLIDDLAGLLDGRAQGAAGPDAFMSWAMVREMAAGGVTFGAHTVTHRLMTAIPLDEARREMTESRAAIGRELGALPATFSYPNGNWNPAVAAAVREAGYTAAFTTDEHAVAPGDDAATLGRVNIHQDATASVPLFLGRLVGAA